jgi:hypothetical protein
MLDRKYWKLGEQVDRFVSASSPAIEEGMVLCEAIEAGIAKVSVVAVPAGAEKIAGIAVLPYNIPSQAVSNEQFVVPASGSLIFNLRNNNLVSLSERAQVPGAADMIIDELNFAAAPPAGTVKVDLAGGRIKFAAADAGKVVNFIYRFNLTVQQARQRYQERSINNRDLVGDLGLLSVAKGYIEMATDQFDSNKNYEAPGVSLYLGPAGKITNGGPGPLIPGGKVLAVPDLSGSAQGPFLRFSALIP